MFKLTKLSALLMFGALTVGASACGGHKYDLHLWHNFGANYSDHLAESFTTPLLENDGIDLYALSKSSYDNLKASLTNAIASNTFPNLATGYPDHFATYARTGYPASRTGILADLTPYMEDEALNAEHKAKYGYTLKEDFYPEYMVENNTIAYSTDDKGLTVGLPFNKSTEVMGYNGHFVDYAKQRAAEDSVTIKIPETWDEWKVYGPLFRQYQMELNGKYLCGDVDADGKGSNLYVSEDSNDPKVILDFTECSDSNTAVLSWDSLANMFITLVRQYDATYTSYTEEDRHQTDVAEQHGYMEFYTGANKEKTKAALQMIRDLSGTLEATTELKNSKRVFAHPAFFGEAGYASKAFDKNKVLFTVCSTGGFVYNLTNEDQRFRVAPIPYKDAAHKYVISQGANLTVFDKESVDKPSMGKEETIKMAFKTVIKMTTGDYQAKWASLTGYYPASRSATNSQIYQSFLNGHEDASDPEFTLKRTIREGAKLNEEEYMTAEKGWEKFVDPGFVGSAEIRTRVEKVISTMITSPTVTLDTILGNVYSDPSVAKYAR